MYVFLNGQLVAEEQASVSVFDRGFLYGDGLFETLRVANGVPFRWARHWERLRRGAEFLGIRLPFTSEVLREQAAELIARNAMPDALLRVNVSRGRGGRGYSPRGADHPTLVMTLHPAPPLGFNPQTPPGEAMPAPSGGSTVSRPAGLPKTPRSADLEVGGTAGLEACATGAHSEVGAAELKTGCAAEHPPHWRLITASPRLPAGEPLALYKTCNKLPQILARAEAEAAGADEALLANTDGFLVEGASSNLFLVIEGTLCTPPLGGGLLPGVTREAVLEVIQGLGLPVREADLRPEHLPAAQGVFLTVTSLGVAVGATLDGRPLAQSPLVDLIWRGYLEVFRRETAK